MFNKKIVVVIVVFLFMFIFITFAGGRPQNQAILTREVTFIDGYDNSQISKQNVIVGEDAVVPKNPNHDNFVFIGWYLKNNDDVKVTSFSNIIDDITVIARYGADENKNGVVDEKDKYYTVTFVDTYNNVVLKSEQVLVGLDANAPNVVNRDGMEFVGWSNDYTNIDGNVTINTVYRVDTDVKVKFYNVTFIDGDSKNVIGIVKVEEGLSAGVPTVLPKHEKRVFSYWKGNCTNVKKNEIVTAIYVDDLNQNSIDDNKEYKTYVTYKKGLDEVTGYVPIDSNLYLEGMKYIVKDKNTLVLDKSIFLGWSKENPNKVITTLEDEKKLTIARPGAELTVRNNDVVYYAVWAIDENGNGRQDYLEDKYKVEFTVDEKYSSLVKGTMKYENILVDLKFYDKVEVPEIIEIDDDKIAFDKWNPVLPDKDAKVTSDLSYEAVFAEDINNNEIPDYLEDTYKVTYHKGLDEVTGEVPVDNNTYLKGIKYVIKSSNNLSLDDSMFLGWSKTNPNKIIATLEEENALEIIDPLEEFVMKDSSLTYYAVWAYDENGSNVPDYKEKKYNVEFTVDEKYSSLVNGTMKYENILEGLKFYDKVEVPLIVVDHYDEISFDKWTPALPEKDAKVTSDLSYEAVFATDKNDNEIPDYLEDTYKVTYHKGLDEVTGEVPVDTNTYLKGIKYIVKGNNTLSLDKFIFLGWSKVNLGKPVTTIEERNSLTLIRPLQAITMEDKDVDYYAIWAMDENKNEEPDYLEDKYKVEFTVDKKYSSLVKGTKKYENILVDLKFYDKVEVPEIIEIIDDKVAFDKWNPVLPDKDAKVTSDLSYEAVFTEDINNNEIPDYLEDTYKVTYHKGLDEVTGEVPVDNNTYLKGIKYVIKSSNNLSLDDSMFLGWSKTNPNKIITTLEEENALEIIDPLEEITMEDKDITYYAVFAIDKNKNNKPDYIDNKYKVEFTVDEKYSSLVNGTMKYENILEGFKFYDKVNIPKIIEVIDDKIAFDKWSPVLPDKDEKVTSNLSYEGVFAEDTNNNEIPDYLEDTYKVTYHKGLDEVTGEVPVDNNTYLEEIEYVVKDKNNLVLDEAVFLGWSKVKLEKKVTSLDEKNTLTLINPNQSMTMNLNDVVYYAVWAIDENKNGIEDYTEDKYKVIYNKGIVINGITPVDNNEYLSGKYVTVLDNIGLLDLNQAVFIGWSLNCPIDLVESEPLDLIKVNSKIQIIDSDIDLYPVFAKDINNNEVPDYLDPHYTVIFKDYNGDVLKSETILVGLDIIKPDDPTRNNTQEFTYFFTGWYLEKDVNTKIEYFTNIQSNLTVVAKYSEIKNKYTVTFLDYNNLPLGTSTVDYGTSAIPPTNPTRHNYTFTGWDKPFDNVIDNMIVKAVYTPNVVGIKVVEKPNVFLQFQVGSQDDIKDYITVYKVYADGSEEIANDDEYTTDFSTLKVVENKKLTITIDGLKDSTLKYDIVDRIAFQTKFEVFYNGSYAYKKTSSSYCTNNCDSDSKTSSVKTNYIFLEVVEHYDEPITINNIKANYVENTSSILNVSDSVRWTAVYNGYRYDPVYIATRISNKKLIDVMTDNLVIANVEITYNRTDYGNFTIVFEYNQETNEFKAVSEQKLK